MTDHVAEPQLYSAEQLARWADRIAEGRDEFPAGLADPDRTSLAELVRERLRARLIRHVARAVANRLGRENKESPK